MGGRERIGMEPYTLHKHGSAYEHAWLHYDPLPFPCRTWSVLLVGGRKG
jgi:hypothetical protein